MCKCLSLSHNAKLHIILIKQTFFQKIFGMLWCFLGNLGDRKGQNANIFLKVRSANGSKYGRLPALLACLLACPLGAGGLLFDT